MNDMNFTRAEFCFYMLCSLVSLNITDITNTYLGISIIEKSMNDAGLAIGYNKIMDIN